MRSFAWYSPEFDVIVLQHFMENCYISFEWDWHEIVAIAREFGTEINAMSLTTWVPLGEV